MSLDEAEKEMKNYKKFSLSERLKVAYYLNSVAYNFDPDSPPKMDKTKFEARKRN